MYPDQQNQNGGQPGYGVNSAPQQAPNGQYDVLPPLPTGQNNGHTGHNPYEFIVNPNTPKQRASLGGNFLLRIGVIVGGAVALMIIAAMVISAVGPKGVNPGMTAIAQRQQEIIRVATNAVGKVSSQDTRNFVTNTELSVTTNQQSVVSYLAAHGVKVNNKLLALDYSSQTDSLLSSAASAGTYDSAVVQTLSTQLQTYRDLLQATYKQATGKQAKAVLLNSYTAATKLAAQAKSLPGSN